MTEATTTLTRAAGQGLFDAGEAGLAEGVVLVEHLSVSYTHLDVYKRHLMN